MKLSLFEENTINELVTSHSEIERKLVNTIEEYNDETGIPKTRIIEDAVREYLDKRNIKLVEV